MVYEIKLRSPKDVKNLNEAALNYEGELFVNCGSTSVNAKSLLALFTLIGSKNINLVAPDHHNPEKFVEVIRKLD